MIDGVFRAAFISVFLLLFVLPDSMSAKNNSEPSKAADVQSRKQQLSALFDEQWQYEMRVNPEWATALGDNRYNDRLSDHSPEFFKADQEQIRKFLSRFEAINPSGLSQQDQLSRELMIRELRQQIEGA